MAIFNGKDLSGWNVPPKGKGHWRVVRGVIDYDAQGGDTLWTKKSFGNFMLKIEWRLKTVKELYGSDRDEQGKPYAYYPDSGLYLRGTSKAQTNVWPKPVGSGEVWGYRADKNLSKEIRDACTPKVRADKPIGQWNKQVVTMKGDRLTVVLRRNDRDRQGPASGHPADRSHRAAASRRLQRVNTTVAACLFLRSVPEDLHQGIVGC